MTNCFPSYGVTLLFFLLPFRQGISVLLIERVGVQDNVKFIRYTSLSRCGNQLCEILWPTSTLGLWRMEPSLVFSSLLSSADREWWWWSIFYGLLSLHVTGFSVIDSRFSTLIRPVSYVRWTFPIRCAIPSTRLFSPLIKEDGLESRRLESIRRKSYDPVHWVMR